MPFEPTDLFELKLEMILEISFLLVEEKEEFYIRCIQKNVNMNNLH